jgi:hypothetical protein
VRNLFEQEAELVSEGHDRNTNRTNYEFVFTAAVWEARAVALELSDVPPEI